MQINGSFKKLGQGLEKVDTIMALIGAQYAGNKGLKNMVCVGSAWQGKAQVLCPMTCN